MKKMKFKKITKTTLNIGDAKPREQVYLICLGAVPVIGQIMALIAIGIYFFDRKKEVYYEKCE